MAVDCYTRGDIINICQGLLLARPDWRDCLEAVAHAVGGQLGDVQCIPVHIIDVGPVVPHVTFRRMCYIDCEAEHATDGGNGG